MENQIKGGYIILPRKIIESPVFSKKPAMWFKIWIYLLCRVLHKDEGDLKRGECFVKYANISDATGATRDQIDKFIRWSKTGESLSTKKTTRGIIVTLANYCYYQNAGNYHFDVVSDTLEPVQATQKRNKSDTIIKEGKEREKKIKEKILKKENPDICHKIFEFFNHTCDTRLKYSPEKQRQIVARLKVFTAEEIMQAIAKRKELPFYNGNNSDGKLWYKDWDSLFRNDGKIDRILNSEYTTPAQSHEQLVRDLFSDPHAS